jgi:hypothetical protein
MMAHAGTPCAGGCWVALGEPRVVAVCRQCGVTRACSASGTHWTRGDERSSTTDRSRRTTRCLSAQPSSASRDHRGAAVPHIHRAALCALVLRCRRGVSAGGSSSRSLTPATCGCTTTRSAWPAAAVAACPSHSSAACSRSCRTWCLCRSGLLYPQALQVARCRRCLRASHRTPRGSWVWA